MRKLDVADILVSIFLILLVIVLSPIWVPVFLYVWITGKVGDFRFSRFIRANEGSRYFCYTARQNSIDFVRENILPQLPAETHIIYITEKYQNMGDETKFFTQVVWQMAGLGKGFPCIAKFSNGEMIIESVNHEVYQAIVRKRDAEQVLKKIDKFFSQRS
ncbi:MAG TPA: hypothetical protein PKA82_12715 [Pyrinomonadaceae bacterium]|nr:hypothetical protein [Pyrinomonadaceae bacterium]